MARRPANRPYGVDDVPHASVIVVNSLQCTALLAGFLVFPLIMTREAHVAPAVADSVLSWSIIVLAIGTTLQALPRVDYFAWSFDVALIAPFLIAALAFHH